MVEVDETLIGGERPGMGSGYRENKSVVIGAVQRGGEIRLRVIPNTRKGNIQGSSARRGRQRHALYRRAESYEGIGDMAPTRNVHTPSTNGSNGDVHTNRVEWVWSLFKRSIVGAFHHISVKHLPAYLDEIEFRFNNRENPFLFRDTLLVLLHSDPLPYKDLVARQGSRRATNRKAPVKALDPEGH